MTTRRKTKKSKRRNTGVIRSFFRMIVVEGAGLLALGAVIGVPVMGNQLPRFISQLQEDTQVESSSTLPLSVIASIFQVD